MRRRRVRLSAAGAGLRPFSSSRARMKRSIGARIQDFSLTAGKAGRSIGWGDQCARALVGSALGLANVAADKTEPTPAIQRQRAIRRANGGRAGSSRQTAAKRKKAPAGRHARFHAAPKELALFCGLLPEAISYFFLAPACLAVAAVCFLCFTALALDCFWLACLFTDFGE